MTMTVIRRQLIPSDAFVLSDIKEHLRILSDDQDVDIATKARTAVAEFEQAAQFALLNQTIKVILWRPGLGGLLRMPIGPAPEGGTATVTADGVELTGFEIIPGHRPSLAFGHDMPGKRFRRVTVEYTAGFGEAASDIPADIAEAIKDQTALHFDGRSPMDAKSLTSSPHMMRVAARYRGVQV